MGWFKKIKKQVQLYIYKRASGTIEHLSGQILATAQLCSVSRTVSCSVSKHERMANTPCFCLFVFFHLFIISKHLCTVCVIICYVFYIIGTILIAQYHICSVLSIHRWKMNNTPVSRIVTPNETVLFETSYCARVKAWRGVIGLLHLN